MNRSILIVICDFLLLSLLTFSTDINKMADENTQEPTKAEVTLKPVEPGQDLAAVMKQALEEERKNQEQLQAELAQARAASQKQQMLLGQNAQETQRLKEQQANLQQQVAMAQTGIQNLNRQLQTSANQITVTKAEAEKQSELAALLQQQLALLNKSNQMVLSEKQQLANQLQLAEVERRSATQQVAMMQQEVQVERAEKAQLAESFKTLATNASQLTREIQSNTPQTPNTIFNDFVANRVNTQFTASRPGTFGFDSTEKSRETETVLVTDGTNIFALCHVEDTPLVLWDPGTDWDQLKGTFSHNGKQVPIHSLSFAAEDPRVIFMPVSQEEASELGCKVYRISSDPYKFQDAVLVGAQEGYYGECGFQIDLSEPQYVKLDRSLIKGLFGKFNPSRGDLVFSRSGELLGIMANNTYCLMLHNFAPAATLPFGRNLNGQHTGETLSRLYSVVFQLPTRLQ